MNPPLHEQQPCAPRALRSSATSRVHPRGFSLLELLLAMTMAAMLALSLYSAMYVATRARASAAAAVEPTRGAMIAMDMVQRDFESVPPPTGTLGGPFYASHLPASVGDNDSIEFCSFGADPIIGDPLDASPLSEGIRRIEFYIGGDAASPALIRRVTRNLLAASEAEAEEEILVRDVRSFSLRYYDGIAWLEDWDSTMLDDALPLAVSITLELGDVAREAPGRRVTRVVPLACAKPMPDGSMMLMGGGL